MSKVARRIDSFKNVLSIDIDQSPGFCKIDFVGSPIGTLGQPGTARVPRALCFSARPNDQKKKHAGRVRSQAGLVSINCRVSKESCSSSFPLVWLTSLLHNAIHATRHSLLDHLLSAAIHQRACPLAPATRPPIVGVAHIAFDVSDLVEARAFYGELLGYDEPFQVFKEDGSLLLTYFKVNDRQYIEIFPGLLQIATSVSRTLRSRRPTSKPSASTSEKSSSRFQIR